MITVKQMERTWSTRQYHRLFRDLAAPRPEAKIELGSDIGWANAAASLAIIRMDELHQSHVALAGELVRTLLAAQQPDGGWSDPAVTALCLRALLCAGGNGAAIDNGIQFLATLQKDEGLWPRFPLRRLPDDAAVSAFILGQLGDVPAFRSAVRMADAVNWFEKNEPFLDAVAQQLWRSAARRCRVQQTSSWS